MRKKKITIHAFLIEENARGLAVRLLTCVSFAAKHSQAGCDARQNSHTHCCLRRPAHQQPIDAHQHGMTLVSTLGCVVVIFLFFPQCQICKKNKKQKALLCGLNMLATVASLRIPSAGIRTFFCSRKNKNPPRNSSG